MILPIKVKAGSKNNQLQKDAAGNFVVKVKAPAVEGKANEAVIAFLSELLGIPKSKLQIKSGRHHPYKRIEIDADANAVTDKLNRYL